jgi:DNA-binding CsgD family transcriptional regulator/PAS domain-containing protein
MSAISARRLSELIGAIYDCAIDPALWPETMREICSDLRCAGSTIVLVDLLRFRPRFLKSWNYDLEAIARDPGYAQEAMSFIGQLPLATWPIDEPLSTARHITVERMQNTRLANEFVFPAGMADSMVTVVARDPQRFGLFAVIRDDSVGPTTDDDQEQLRLLAPHIRRAITISDLLDLKALEVSAFSAALDRFAAGVIVVAEENRILLANETAREMFSEGGPIVSRKGRLAANDRTANAELGKAIDMARGDEAAMGAAGIGVSLGSSAEQPVIAHVLPLAQGELRTRLLPKATAAVFVTAPATSSTFDFNVLTRTYGLTPAEIRLCEQLSAGRTLNEAAQQMKVSITTARTHLARVFAKTDVSRQTDLVALIHRIAPPLRQTHS